MQTLSYLAIWFVDAAAMLALIALIIGLAAIALMWRADRFQRQHAVRRNFPVIGRFRYGIENLGPFLRQYLFDTDRGLLPFNRAERSWVYRASKNVDNTAAFGSTLDVGAPGSIIFANSVFPVPDGATCEHTAVTLGPYCAQPYTPPSLFNISGMSYGALSAPAVTALSRGAAKAHCWLTTGEGGLSPYHLDGGCDIVMQIGTAKYGVRDTHGRLSDDRL